MLDWRRDVLVVKQRGAMVAWSKTSSRATIAGPERFVVRTSILCSMGVSELLRAVVRQDGFRALYRGATPSLLGIIPYAGIAFSINEQAKHEVSKKCPTGPCAAIKSACVTSTCVRRFKS